MNTLDSAGDQKLMESSIYYNNMSDKNKSAIKRFIKVFIGSFVAQAILVIPSNFDSVDAYLNAVLVAGASGLILGLQKYLSWES